MDKGKKSIIVNNVIFLILLFVSCTMVFNDIGSMLMSIYYSKDTIQDLNFSYHDITVYTASETYHLGLNIPLIIVGVGIVNNLLYLLVYYLKK
ncbi:hypothetical protein KCTCHS21_37280 [Cohnella abietis]|uniref:Uncharacterized protein n=1 Tax=Cohnella abietis TaxID=2507935 RepID=A0A3T1D8D0_9BACL|nr:hypothetical protein KCTCHS21_37280 [Cohnella abietis]